MRIIKIRFMKEFSDSLISWQKKEGRNDLPWQININPYKVWVSEIMLQQTQVKTVIPYFNKFIKSFPNVKALSKASEDKVLSLWSGLGYYSRARNLHKSSSIIVKKFNGDLPSNLEDLESLPGVGRSTAGAILSIGFGLPSAILDANVERVLSRFFAFNENINKFASQKKLWNLSESLVPSSNSAKYTQAIMDLGATVCKKNNPSCNVCPVAKMCLALEQEKVNELPLKAIPKKKVLKSVYWLVLEDKEKRLFLEKRHQDAVWKGLWSFKEFSNASDLKKFCELNIGKGEFSKIRSLELKHSFSHYNLDVKSIYIRSDKTMKNKVNESSWFNKKDLIKVGIPRPTKRIIEMINEYV